MKVAKLHPDPNFVYCKWSWQWNVCMKWQRGH